MSRCGMNDAVSLILLAVAALACLYFHTSRINPVIACSENRLGYVQPPSINGA